MRKTAAKLALPPGDYISKTRLCNDHDALSAVRQAIKDKTLDFYTAAMLTRRAEFADKTGKWTMSICYWGMVMRRFIIEITEQSALYL